MKILTKALIVMLFSFSLAILTQPAKAYNNDGYSGQNGNQAMQGGDVMKKIKRFRRWCRSNGFNRRQCIRALRDRRQGQGVPEISLASAPLGVMAIGGLLALGFENRRRKLNLQSQKV